MESVEKKVQKGGVPRKWVIVGGLTVLLALACGLIWIVYFSPKAGLPQEFDQYKEVINQLQREEPPADPLSRAIYYGQLGQAYRENKERSKSIENYLKAQAVIDENKLADQYVFYQALADVYAEDGNHAKEKEYLQKQIDYLKSWQAQNPDETGSEEAVKILEERLKKV